MTQKTHSSDLFHRFHFDDQDVRGEIVSLDNSFEQATEHQKLPANLKALLGEFLTATTLLADVLKFEGLLVLQVRGNGPIPLIMAEATDTKNIRGIIKSDESYTDEALGALTFNELIGEGVLSLTIDPKKGKRYQGIVSLEGDSLSACLNAYFKQSEQLPTHLWLAANDNATCGLLIQALPTSHEHSDENTWMNVYQLAATIKKDELLSLDHDAILYRLFNEYQTRVTAPQTVTFVCSCSRERSLNALSALSKDEAYSLLAEQGEIGIDCQFCGKHYGFGEPDLAKLYSTNGDKLH